MIVPEVAFLMYSLPRECLHAIWHATFETYFNNEMSCLVFVIACQIALQLVRQGAIIEPAVPVAELDAEKVESIETSTESVEVSSNKQNNETLEEAEIVHTDQTPEEAEIVQTDPQPDNVQSPLDQPTDSKVSER
jgi:hypothetical protein